MKITKIIAIAGVSCLLFSAPAFAQSSATKAEDYAKDKAASEAKDAVNDEAKDMIKGHDADQSPASDPLMIKSPSEAIAATEGEIAVSDDGMMLKGKDIMTESKPEMTKKPAMMDAPTTATTTVVIACPEGTTAQDDGTCMITGDEEE
ncbi:MAG: hypothetical protein ABJN22_14175 [Litorimonas sp.]